MKRREGFGWPDAGTLRCYILCGLAMDALFFMIYYGAQWNCSIRSDVHRVYFEWELAIPLAPWMAVLYLSMFPLFLLPLFRISLARMRLLFKQLFAATLAAGAVFFTFPAILGYGRRIPSGWSAPLFEFMFRIDPYPCNTIPSLHVIYSGLILLSLRDASAGVEKALYTTWMVSIILSTVLVHQHHLADIAGGVAVIWLCREAFRFGPRKHLREI